ncbi:MAG: UbiH/UbiF/VisC/COQ6 family ubiquinone biosynthesis hydroxylase [Pseudomonadales bacterium]
MTTLAMVIPNVLETDVLIVGGGLVGLSLASALKPGGLTVTLIDAGPAPHLEQRRSPSRQDYLLDSGINPRVSTINPASYEFLKRINGWPVDDRVCALTGMLVWDARGTARIEFDTTMTDDPYLGYVVENLNILSRLYEGARNIPGVTLHFETTIESIRRIESGYLVRLAGGTEIGCNLLVGADGGNSVVRNACQMRAIEWSYDQDAIVTTILTQERHGNIARQCFTEHGPLAFLPLSSDEQNLCSIVWSSDVKQELIELSDDEFCRRLTRASESVLGDIIATDQRFSFPLRAHHALRYTKPHIALVGDAAHTIHPLAGQGANLGLADSRALANLLNDCRLTGQEPGHAGLLRRYEASRQPADLLMTIVMEGFKRLYQSGSPAVNWLRNTGTRLVDKTPGLKSLVIQLASGR